MDYLGDVACLVSHADMNTHTIYTSVGSALIEALIYAHEVNHNAHGKIKGYINDAWSKNKHTIKRNDWNANVSFKTYQKLKSDGILV